jgi:hypothetical protein
MTRRLWYVALVLLGAASSWDRPAAAETSADQRPPTTSLAGTLRLPDTAPGATGEPLPVMGLSGITWLGDDRYAAIMDNSDRLLVFRLECEADSSPKAVHDLKIVTLSRSLDYEDLAPCPDRLAATIARCQQDRGEDIPRRCVLVCEESTPAIRAIDLDSGALLGVVPIPAILNDRRPNRGLEALAVDPDGVHIWTANEEALPADGPPAAEDGGTVVRIARIAIPDERAAGDGHPSQFAYAVDPPHRFVRVATGEPLSGVVAIVALGDNRLLVLERSGGFGLPPFESRIYLVDVTTADDVSDITEKLAEQVDLHVTKTPLWREALGCNLEGLCLGPRVNGGGRLLVGVADNGGLGTPSQLVTFVMRDEPEGFDASWIGAAAAVAAAAILVLRLTNLLPCSTR